MSSGFAEKSNQKLLRETLMDIGAPANITSIKQEIFNKINDNVSRRLIGNVIRETLQTGVESGDIQRRSGKYFVNKSGTKRKAENEPVDATAPKSSKGNRSVLSDDEQLGGNRSRSRMGMVRKRSSSKSITVKKVRATSKTRRTSGSRKAKSPRRSRSGSKSRSRSRKRSASKSRSKSRK